MKTILANYDSSGTLNEIIDSALNLGSLFNTAITFAHIAEKPSGEAGQLQSRLQELLSQRSIPSRTTINYISKEGKPYVELVNIAKDIDAGSIITKVDIKKGFKLFNDNTAYHTVVTAPCPVFTLGDKVKIGQIKSILVPLDTSSDTRQKIPIAMQIAKQSNATIHVVAFGTDRSDQEKTVKLQNYSDQSRNFLQEKGFKTVSNVIYGKNFLDMINEYAKKNCDLLIITADEETSIFSSASEKLIGSCPIPVLSIQPKDLKVSWAGL